jgi:hypothetical protein
MDCVTSDQFCRALPFQMAKAFTQKGTGAAIKVGEGSLSRVGERAGRANACLGYEMTRSAWVF